jgi:hypothetical protein
LINAKAQPSTARPKITKAPGCHHDRDGPAGDHPGLLRYGTIIGSSLLIIARLNHLQEIGVEQSAGLPAHDNKEETPEGLREHVVA